MKMNSVEIITILISPMQEKCSEKLFLQKPESSIQVCASYRLINYIINKKKRETECDTRSGFRHDSQRPVIIIVIMFSQIFHFSHYLLILNSIIIDENSEWKIPA